MIQSITNGLNQVPPYIFFLTKYTLSLGNASHYRIKAICKLRITLINIKVVKINTFLQEGLISIWTFDGSHWFPWVCPAQLVLKVSDSLFIIQSLEEVHSELLGIGCCPLFFCYFCFVLCWHQDSFLFDMSLSIHNVISPQQVIKPMPSIAFGPRDFVLDAASK